MSLETVSKGPINLVRDDNEYQNYKKKGDLGEGCFGTVDRMIDTRTDEECALKYMEIKDQIKYYIKELMIKDLDTNYVVEYHKHWSHYENRKEYLVIRMPVYKCSLRVILNLMNELFYETKNGSKSLVEENHRLFVYFISCQLLIELTECVRCLHSLATPIIHRDLKPENILITAEGNNGRFLRLCDFGLATEHETSNHTRDKGNDLYKAPEVFSGQKYNLKCDIYSLALIATQIFNFGSDFDDFRRDTNFLNYMDCFKDCPQLSDKCQILCQTLADCLFPESDDYHKRPDSEKFLQKINLISIDKNVVKQSEHLESFKMFVGFQDKYEILDQFFQIKISD